MSFVNIPSASWRNPVLNVASLPAGGNQPGDAIVTLDTYSIYVWNGSTWVNDSSTGVTFPLLASNGTAAAPSYSFTNSTGTGIFSSASNTLSLAANGSNALNLTYGSSTASLITPSTVNLILGTADVTTGTPGTLTISAGAATISGPSQGIAFQSGNTTPVSLGSFSGAGAWTLGVLNTIYSSSTTNTKILLTNAGVTLGAAGNGLVLANGVTYTSADFCDNGPNTYYLGYQSQGGPYTQPFKGALINFLGLGYPGGITSGFTLPSANTIQWYSVSSGTSTAGGAGVLAAGDQNVTSATANAGNMTLRAGNATGGSSTGNGGSLTLAAGTTVGGTAGSINFQTAGSTQMSIDASGILHYAQTTANASGSLTLTNAPTGKSGNPTGYLTINVSGTNRVIPYW